MIAPVTACLPTIQRALRAFAFLALLSAVSACRGHASEEESTAASGADLQGPPIGPPPDRPTPRVGMAWIPGGALVAGTPAEKLPRLADEEMAGEQVILDGFYIDRFLYPNEEGAIPVTGVTQEEARALCAEQGKRLCSELEWERACKGPDNRTYEYGEQYRQSVCDTGKPAQLRPSGLNLACRSDFGVHDLHGSAWEWTDSPWGRGTDDGRVTLRGGNDRAGELVARCANGRPERPDTRSGVIGFRCCMGPRNGAEVNLHLAFGRGLLPRAKFDDDLERSLLAALPGEVRSELEQVGTIRTHRAWLWRPVGNEELHVLALCARGAVPGRDQLCGLSVSRVTLGRVDVLTWASSGLWIPTLHPLHGGVRDLWMVGGDRIGSFKRMLAYRWGRVHTGELSRGVPKPSTTR